MYNQTTPHTCAPMHKEPIIHTNTRTGERAACRVIEHQHISRGPDKSNFKEGLAVIDGSLMRHIHCQIIFCQLLTNRLRHSLLFTPILKIHRHTAFQIRFTHQTPLQIPKCSWPRKQLSRTKKTEKTNRMIVIMNLERKTQEKSNSPC